MPFHSPWLFHFAFPIPLASFPGSEPCSESQAGGQPTCEVKILLPTLSSLPCGLYALTCLHPPSPTQHIEILSLDSNSCSTHQESPQPTPKVSYPSQYVRESSSEWREVPFLFSHLSRLPVACASKVTGNRQLIETLLLAHCTPYCQRSYIVSEP